MFFSKIKEPLTGLSITALVCVVLGFAQTATASNITELKDDLFNFLTDMPEKQFQIHPDDLPKQPEKFYLIVDVRSSDEYNYSHVGGAINLPFSDNQEHLEANLPIDKKTDILLYSQDANRSIYALIFYYLSGYENVRYIDGGLTGWEAANRKISVLQPSLEGISDVAAPSIPSTPVIQIVRGK